MEDVVPGDVVELRNETLYVNGKIQPVDFLPEQKNDDGEPILLGTENLGGRTHPFFDDPLADQSRVVGRPAGKQDDAVHAVQIQRV